MRIKTGSDPAGVFILGMHRSGTSCLTGMLGQYGLFLGNVRTSGRFNPKGNQEIPEVNRINNQLLAGSKGAWHRPAVVTRGHPHLKTRIGRMRNTLEKSNRLWGIKDPRLLYCLPLWKKPGDCIIATFRHPSAVTASLASRNRSLPEERQLNTNWQELWHKYNCRLIHLYETRPFPLINFDWPPEKYCRAVRQAACNLGLQGEHRDFFSPLLR
ncbi:MAG: hypothetical protein MI863_20210, partial [Desulfobacterales bacterium]|nr:hypothetical protein [Desulfobacterales bacterium]